MSLSEQFLDFIFLFLTMVFYWAHLGSFFPITTLKLGQFSTIFSNLTILASLILRWLNSGHFPLSNLATSKVQQLYFKVA